ncbi:malto-oligosyltrehalose trehalohydrolase [uncultured Ferrovibrio sp.]|jgi:maltooligosyltrehalose trehalohydrolase|uniref:malto-oligosyltrehalose trehalohydrolase n=1 Tax=uncultured Ferrovibrio sp. TaxID=1576913 RepID=UPI00262FE491|nr:malto-oligosyltrehalose trehalohydrolase [uncultured Ferrovibrio sp.]
MSGELFGPRLLPDGGVEFRLWAPAARQVDLVIAEPRPMTPAEDGWFKLAVSDAGPGTRYRFRIDGEQLVPDPASRYQPEDVDGPSEVVAQDFDWKASDWRGHPWGEAVFLELHLGAFSKEGTYQGAMAHLDHLVETGITAIELMPLADFAGSRNWGYDGVLLYAPDSSYGRPEDLKALIDAAHQRGLMVFLDVVYNHFGPKGNYLHQYAPDFFSRDHQTPWGGAIDYRVPQVRSFAIENALYWLREFRFDGLRLDAVHAIRELGSPSVLESLSHAVGRFARQSGRHIHLVLENDDNAATLLNPAEDIPDGRYRAQWNDDYHHAWHVLLSGEQVGYYEDYATAPQGFLERCLSGGFAYQGEVSAHRGGELRGEPTDALPSTAFVNFLQNHDQIGNRPFGERLEALAPPEAIEAALAITLLLPMIPLLFMGEEWGARQPFPFFCDFSGDLAQAVEEGRRREFAPIYKSLPPGKDIPSALAESTFLSTKLDWSEPNGKGKARLQLVRHLLKMRQKFIAPRLKGHPQQSKDVRIKDGVAAGTWILGDGSRLHLRANLTGRETVAPSWPSGATAIWPVQESGQADPSARLSPWSVVWLLEAV